MTTNENTIATFWLLAGAYAKGLDNVNAGLTHSHREGDAKTLCGKIKVEKLADGCDDDVLDTVPTCAACAKKDPRFK